MKISITNSKLGNQIPSLNLPPLKTCRANAPCKKGCYALKGNWIYPNVKNSLENNLNDFLENPNQFFNDIVNYLNNGLTTYKFFRWFSSGDIVNERFLNGMIEVAKKCKQTKFLCFTKKFEIVNNYLNNGGKIPNNLKIVFSAWTKDFKVDNPHNLPMTYVFFKKEENNPKIPSLAIPCKGKCDECLACWSLKKGQSVFFNQH